ncbi:MAG: S46 family peptidase [Ignavibacterium sp.]|nr:S46 family peptidase [Ignavibacterium sp.]MDW8374802.1 S46 family peptidase [Ignavibacteriales bacterium]
MLIIKIFGKKFSFQFIHFVLAIFVFISINQAQTHFPINLDTVKAQRFDMGKMWTFEDPPLDYFKSEYNFNPSKDWFEKLQKSALKLGGGCSASFVSEDGLIMTNHHCIRGILPSVQKENENILKNGFIANNLQEERKINNLKVEQLLIIEDVTDQIQNAIYQGKTDEEKLSLLESEVQKITNQYQSKFPDLTFRVTSLYNGGKYSLYGYKVYNDIRLVFVPELSVAKLGGDYDNFTYPRYGLDCAFLRAYENGKPIKTNYFFKWSNQVVEEDQLVFVVGNPGSTDRLNTFEQIEFERDYRYSIMVPIFKDLYNIYEQLVIDSNAEDYRLIARLFSIGNALKVYEGTYKGLLDPVLLARKRDFEKNFKQKVFSDKNLKEKYGNLWTEISNSISELKKYSKTAFAYTISNLYSPQYLVIASRLSNLLDEVSAGKIKSEDFYQEALKLYPKDLNDDLQKKLLQIQLKVWKNYLPAESDINKFFNKFISVDEIISNSYLTSQNKFNEFIKKTLEEIKSTNDPFLFFVKSTQNQLKILNDSTNRINQRLTVLNQMLGEALYKIYGNSIPPDATGTLRIADGIVKSYEYNGTRAPIKTTFYGALDRYYSFDKKFPFNLPKYWENLPVEFDLSSPLNFISTNDIVGGNSGSAVLNLNAEVIGLAFDGNIESLPNNFIYTTEANRTVSVATLGMYNAIKYIYKAENLAKELINGKIESE